MDSIRESTGAVSLQADLFGSSTQPAQIVELRLIGEQLQIRGSAFTQQIPARRIRWPRTGDSGICLLELPDGALLHCRSDALLRQWSAAAQDTAIPWCRHLRNAGLALAAATLVWAGLPAVAESLLTQVPRQIDRHVGQRLLDRLDAQWLQPSTLPAQTQQAWRQRLTDAVTQACPAVRLPAWNLQFRRNHGDSASNGTGAIGLPGGTVVLLDEQLGRGTLHALCNELGQLQQRQGMRTLARNQPVSLLMGVAFDDFSSTVAVAWPVLAQHRPFTALTGATAGSTGSRTARR
ncbi:hypothetical protein [Sphaerotilus sp.]|uniref:DUF7092 domain-containing protein n=1 Tax=Sphaerotilus sp. TaxID=2093942 RepID=UPI0034E28016